MKRHVWIMNHYAGDMLFNQGGRHYNFAKYLKQAGYEPVVFCANSKHGKPERFFDMPGLWDMRTAEEIGVPWIFVKARTYTGNGKQRILNMVDFYRNVKKAAREYAAQHGKPDVIYASSVHPLTLVAGIQLAKHFGVECVCEVRDLWPETIVAYGIAGPHNPAVLALRWLEKWIYAKADAVVFTMEGAYDYIKEQGWEKDVPRDKVFYINNGVDLEQFDYNREHFPVEDADLDNAEQFNVVYSGSIRRVNNLGLLLEVAKQVKNPRIKFLIWGDGDEREMLEQRVREESITNVAFKGRVDKKYVPSIVSQASLNIAHNTPSPMFRFGVSFNKLFDYLAAGKPILSDFPCPHNPMVTCGGGEEVPSADPKQVACEIERMAGLSHEQLQVYCSNAHRAAEDYDFKHLTQKLLAVIDSIPKKERRLHGIHL